MSSPIFVTGVLLVIAALVTAVVATITGQWIVAAAMAICAVSVGAQVWNA